MSDSSQHFPPTRCRLNTAVSVQAFNTLTDTILEEIDFLSGTVRGELWRFIALKDELCAGCDDSYQWWSMIWYHYDILWLILNICKIRRVAFATWKIWNDKFSKDLISPGVLGWKIKFQPCFPKARRAADGIWESAGAWLPWSAVGIHKCSQVLQ